MATKKSLVTKMFGSGEFKLPQIQIPEITPQTRQKVSRGVQAIKRGAKSGYGTAMNLADRFGDWASERQSVQDMFGGSGGFGDWEMQYPFVSPASRPRTTATQRVEAAMMSKKAGKLARSLGVSQEDALEYIQTRPQQPRHAKHNKPRNHERGESDQQRRTRERKRYDDLLRRGISPSYAIQTIEQERGRRH